MRLEHLRSDFLKLPHAEQAAIVRHIRADRLINKRVAVKETKVAEKVASKKREKTAKSFDTLLANVGSMTEEQIAALVAKLGG